MIVSLDLVTRGTQRTVFCVMTVSNGSSGKKFMNKLEVKLETLRVTQTIGSEGIPVYQGRGRPLMAGDDVIANIGGEVEVTNALREVACNRLASDD